MPWHLLRCLQPYGCAEFHLAESLPRLLPLCAALVAPLELWDVTVVVDLRGLGSPPDPQSLPQCLATLAGAFPVRRRGLLRILLRCLPESTGAPHPSLRGDPDPPEEGTWRSVAGTPPDRWNLELIGEEHGSVCKDLEWQLRVRTRCFDSWIG